MNNISAASLALIWGNLRNYSRIDLFGIDVDIRLTNTVEGKFPIDSHNPLYLEIPKNNRKSNLSGRKNRVTCNDLLINIWDYNRIIHLPNYEITCDNIDIETLRTLLFQWPNSLIPEEIPCIAISCGTNGFYSEIRSGHFVTVLLIWHDLTGRILELDWYEGGEDDCITPEWYIKSSKLSTSDKTINKFINICKTRPSLANPVFSIHLNPFCLGNCLREGKLIDYCQPWHYEWTYRDQNDLVNDLELLERKLSEIFYKQ